MYRKSPRAGCKTALAAERNRRLRRPRSSSRLPDQARRSPLQWQRWPLQCQPQSPNLACAECWRCSSPSITLLAGICTLPRGVVRPGLRSSLDVRKKKLPGGGLPWRRRRSAHAATELWRLGGRERLTGGCQIVDRSGCATGIGHASSHRIHPRDRSDSRRRPVAALPNIPPRSDVRHSPFGAMSVARRRQLLVLGHFHCEIVTGRIGRSRARTGLAYALASQTPRPGSTPPQR